MFPCRLTEDELQDFRHLRVIDAQRNRIDDLRDAGRVDEAARATIAVWDDTAALPFGAYARVNILLPPLKWAVRAVPWVRADLEARARALQDELARRAPTAADVIGLAVLAHALNDTDVRVAAGLLARTLDSLVFDREMVHGTHGCVNMWLLGLGEIAGRYLPPIPALMDDLEQWESSCRVSAQESHAVISAMIRRKGLPINLDLSPQQRSENNRWQFNIVVARCLHAAGRNADALAVLRRAGERGKEVEARALIEELGLE